jgi:hypothetical protein
MNIFFLRKKDFPFSLTEEKRVEWLIRKNRPKTEQNTRRLLWNATVARAHAITR